MAAATVYHAYFSVQKVTGEEYRKMARRKYQWVGHGNVIVPKTDASTPTSELLELVPAVLRTSAAGPRTDCLIEAIYVHVHTHRLLTTTLDACGIIVWTAVVSEGADAPAQSLNAIPTDARAYGNKNILIMAPVPVPPLLGSSDLLSVTPDDQVMVSSYEYQASRKLDRQNQVLALTINSDVSSVLRCFVQVRVLLSWGS